MQSLYFLNDNQLSKTVIVLLFDTNEYLLNLSFI
jgi:hypothetical protein